MIVKPAICNLQSTICNLEEAVYSIFLTFEKEMEKKPGEEKPKRGV